MSKTPATPARRRQEKKTVTTRAVRRQVPESPQRLEPILSIDSIQNIAQWVGWGLIPCLIRQAAVLSFMQGKPADVWDAAYSLIVLGAVEQGLIDRKTGEDTPEPEYEDAEFSPPSRNN